MIANRPLSLCLLSSLGDSSSHRSAESTSSLLVFPCRYLHRTFLVKSGTTFELHPISFKFRPDHRCHLVPIKVCIFSGLERPRGALPLPGGSPASQCRCRPRAEPGGAHWHHLLSHASLCFTKPKTYATLMSLCVFNCLLV